MTRNAVGLQADSRWIRIVEWVPRRWWQFWKPEFQKHYLGEVEYPVQNGDDIQFKTLRNRHFVYVNGAVILAWPNDV